MWTVIYTLVVPNSCEIATRICQFSQNFGTNVSMLFEIVKSVEIVITLGKQLFYRKILDAMQNIILLLLLFTQINTLYNVCSVHRGMFSTSGGVQYIGGIS